MTIVLASASRVRRALLERAGVGLRVDPASIDEATVKESLAAGGAKPAQMAETLAELKAQRISPKYPGLIVLGADQILECAGKLFDKPVDLGDARGQLQALRGRKHRLLSSPVTGVKSFLFVLLRNASVLAQARRRGTQRPSAGGGLEQHPVQRDRAR